MTYSVLAGEIVHHLRSVLDHLVWQLVLVNGNRPTERNEFPICDTRSKFDESIKRKKLTGVSTAVESKIESLQPYHFTKLEASWLWVIHELDRIDKHRLLVVLLAAMRLGQRIVLRQASDHITITGMTPPNWVSATPTGAEVFRIELGEPYPESVSFEAEFEMAACIDHVGSISMPKLVPTLLGALAGIRSAIQSFEKDF
jgi:hypothetical protein